MIDTESPSAPALKLEPVPLPVLPVRGWRELALEIAWSTWRDIHLKGSALLIGALVFYGKCHPEVADACNETAKVCAGYFTASALQRKS